MDHTKYIKTLGFNSNQPVGRGFNYPYDIDFSSDGRIFLVNRMGGLNSRGVRIQIFTFDEEWLSEFGTGPGNGDDQFTIPVCIAINKKDDDTYQDGLLKAVHTIGPSTPLILDALKSKTLSEDRLGEWIFLNNLRVATMAGLVKGIGVTPIEDDNDDWNLNEITSIPTEDRGRFIAVSYTHLTLPTILLV